MDSLQRLRMACNHELPDRVPFDIGGSCLTGMHVSTVYKLRQFLGLDPPHTPVKVVNVYMMLGEIAPDLMDYFGSDTIELLNKTDIFGLTNDKWKDFELDDGTPILVPDNFNTIRDEHGNLLLYPSGDITAEPSGLMPKGGYYFDAVIRQNHFKEDSLDPLDNINDVVPIKEEALLRYQEQCNLINPNGDKAIIASLGGTSFGDIGLVPGTWLKDPKGIRDIEEWYISLSLRREHIYEIFEGQCNIAIENLKRINKVIGDKIFANIISGTDFGGQQSLLFSPETYRQLFKPFFKRVNDWIHENTNWKTIIHSCGAILELIPDFIEDGFDILNPVQISAKNMDPTVLKKEFGKHITFWGGGVDTQRTLPFGDPNQVRDEVKNLVKTFKPGGGYVFSPVHNVQANTPVENIIAMIESFKRHRNY